MCVCVWGGGGGGGGGEGGRESEEREGKAQPHNQRQTSGTVPRKWRGYLLPSAAGTRLSWGLASLLQWNCPCAPSSSLLTGSPRPGRHPPALCWWASVEHTPGSLVGCPYQWRRWVRRACVEDGRGQGGRVWGRRGHATGVTRNIQYVYILITCGLSALHVHDVCVSNNNNYSRSPPLEVWSCRGCS